MSGITILATGAGAPGAASIFKAFRLGAREEGRKLRIVACDTDNDAYGFHLADAQYTIPAGKSPVFIDSIKEICRRESPDIMFSWVDPELYALAKNKGQVEVLGPKIVISNTEAVEICLDKGRLYEYASGLNIVPEHRLARTHADFEEAAQALGYPDRPVCFKPLEGHGGRGFGLLDSKLDSSTVFFAEKAANVFTSIEDMKPIFRGAQTPNLMVMEYLPGKEYTVDMLLKNGEPVVTIPRERARISLGISNIAKLERNGEIIKASEQLARKLGLDYNVNMQFRTDSEGKPKLIEVQPRLAGTTAASVGAGANLPWMAAKLALGEDVEKPKINWNTMMKRFWEEVYTDGARDWRL